MTGLIGARFLDRPHRFAVTAELAGGQVVEAHLGDPGRLRELLRPGAMLRLRPAQVSRNRKTGHTVTLVRSGDPPFAWVSVETARANELAAKLLRDGTIRGLGAHSSLRREVRRGRSRLDFMLEDAGGGRAWVEVKSVTLVDDGVALFPDAPTRRGRRHVEDLIEAVRSGDRAAVLFVVQRGDARGLRPHRGIDPGFADALAKARRAGVLLRAAAFRMAPGGAAIHLGPLRVRI